MNLNCVFFGPLPIFIHEGLKRVSQGVHGVKGNQEVYSNLDFMVDAMCKAF